MIIFDLMILLVIMFVYIATFQMQCSELVSNVMFLLCKFAPQNKVVQEIYENEDVHDSISKTKPFRQNKYSVLIFFNSFFHDYQCKLKPDSLCISNAGRYCKNVWRP